MGKENISGTVFNIQRYSTDDGQGIRTCVFLKGCPLRCTWCHNAESLQFSPELAFYVENCIGCQGCAPVCPSGAISFPKGIAQPDRSRCTVCGKCAEACCADALCMVGKKMGVQEVIETVLRDKPFYGSSGGMTLTGGEPLAQPKFSLALAEKAWQSDIRVCIETSGWGNTADLLSFLPYCDRFLFDCKAASSGHRKLTGKDDTLILKNLEALCAAGGRVLLRCPVVQGANLEAAFVEKIIALGRQYPQIDAIQLMPYHQTGTSKAFRLGKPPQRIFSVPSGEILDNLVQYIGAASGKKVFYR